MDKKYIVCIDAGHGADTAGKRSPDGTYLEHEFNFDVAGRIKAHLERCGVEVILTRSGNMDVSLARRCEISNNAAADLFLSVHTNAAGEGWSRACGWSAHIIAKGGDAEKLACAIHSASLSMLGCKDRGVNQDNYQVLRDTKCPAVLIEHGFHTNRSELEKLKSDKYRALCAESDARGIAAHLGIKWTAENSVASKLARAIALIREAMASL